MCFLDPILVQHGSARAPREDARDLRTTIVKYPFARAKRLRGRIHNTLSKEIVEEPTGCCGAWIHLTNLWDWPSIRTTSRGKAAHGIKAPPAYTAEPIMRLPQPWRTGMRSL